MKRLSTNFMGIHLKNPIIAGASNISDKLDNIKRLEEAGVAAIVFKSLFEEQIQLEKLELEADLEEYDERHAEMITTHPHMEHAGIEEHLVKLRKAKESVSIPVIASLNAIHGKSWIEYAKKLQDTGVDGLELNMYSIPKRVDLDAAFIENEHLEKLTEIRRAVKIPISVKISPFYTNIMNVVYRMSKGGADGTVLFNRLYEADIDVKSETTKLDMTLSSSDEMRLPLRYTGLLEGRISADICSSRGIYTGDDVLKMILAGAKCVQIVSAVYKHGYRHVGIMLEDIVRWMDSKGYENIEDFRGKLSKSNLKDPYAYERAQYVDLLMRPFESLIKEPMR